MRRSHLRCCWLGAAVTLAAGALTACGGASDGASTTTLPTLPPSSGAALTTAAVPTVTAGPTSPPLTAPVGPAGTIPPPPGVVPTVTTVAGGPVNLVPEPATGALRLGHRGSRVRTLQGQLATLGYQLDVDGLFGRGTEAAVKAFQQAQRLNSDGIAGPATQARLAQLAPAG